MRGCPNLPGGVRPQTTLGLAREGFPLHLGEEFRVSLKLKRLYAYYEAYKNRTTNSVMAERPRELGDFKRVDHYEDKFQVEGLRFTPISMNHY